MDNVKFLALDVSLSSTGLAILSMAENNKFILHAKNSIQVKQKKGATRFDRKYDIYQVFEYYVEQYAKELKFAVFENYAYGATGQLIDLAELSALYKLVLAKNNIPFDVIPPKSSKLIITGYGDASKEEVADALPRFIINYADFSFNTLDETDAIANGIAFALKMMEDVDEPE